MRYLITKEHVKTKSLCFSPWLRIFCVAGVECVWISISCGVGHRLSLLLIAMDNETIMD